MKYIRLVVCLVSASAYAETDAAREMKQLQDQRQKSLAATTESIDRRYRASLEELQRRATLANDLDAAVKIKSKIDSIGAASVATTPLTAAPRDPAPPPASQAPTEFLNIPWKATPAIAKRLMAQRAGVTIKEETPERLILQGGMFATHTVERWDLEFPGGQFRRGTVYVTIPPGNAQDGVPLRNHQFEEYCNSLTEKYGKGNKIGDGSHTECVWTWTTTDPRSSQKDTISILLFYGWGPYVFKVQYSSKPPDPVEKPVKKTDL